MFLKLKFSGTLLTQRGVLLSLLQEKGKEEPIFYFHRFERLPADKFPLFPYKHCTQIVVRYFFNVCYFIFCGNKTSEHN